ncbi:hypothetical protein [Flavobacterium sp.]|jgi:hypothetical protein
MKFLVFLTTFTITFFGVTALFSNSEPTVIIKEASPITNYHYHYRH